jgi:hypothetical protein
MDRPQVGDVLVSKSPATVDHRISFVPHPPHITRPNHDRAVKEGLELAAHHKLDAWLTEDNCHFLCVGTFRR